MGRCVGAVAVGILTGLAIAVAAPWLLFNVRDTNLLGAP